MMFILIFLQIQFAKLPRWIKDIPRFLLGDSTATLP